jgi:hypothetical protein
MSAGAKEDEANTGRVWAFGFHRVFGPFSPGARFETYKTFIYLIFQFRFRAAVNRG